MARNKKRWAVNKHHLSNKKFGFGSKLPNGGDNILRMKKTRHALLHQMFENLSWEEIHDLLNQIFGVGEPNLVVKMMGRISRIKHRTA